MVTTKIVNEANNKEFLLKAVKRTSFDLKHDVTAVSTSGTSASSNTLLGFTGEKENESFVFTVFDDGTDVSNGTHSSTITDYEEQVRYLRDEVKRANETDTHRIEGIRGENITGRITRINGEKRRPFEWELTLEFKRGNPV